MAKMFDGELQTIFVNILDNACYWTQKRGSDKKIVISSELSESDNRLKILISDTGVGISKENAQAIFEPGITSKPHGIGMGLVIVAEILDYYGGKIATLIPGEFGGATFILDIPIL
jgi:two-component system sensor kinase FixL